MELEALFVGESESIRKLRKEIVRLGKVERNLLLVGERGVGKATIARLIHKQVESKGPLVMLDPFTSTESDVRGIAEAGSVKPSILLIRDVEEFSFLLQTEIQKLIGQLPRRPSVRIIATVKKGVRELYENQKLIEGLCAVLAEFETVGVPPLSQRQEDIPLLVEHFTKKACDGVGARLKALDINTLDFLTRREWRENVSELKFVIEKAVVTSDNQLIELPEYMRDEQAQLHGILALIKGKKPFSFDKSLANLERTLIEKALEVTGYNQSNAAKILNLSEANLRYRLKKFHLSKPKD